MTKENIKSLLGLKNWSIRCERIWNILKNNEIKDYFLRYSSDYHYASRKTRNPKYNYENVGCETFGKQYRNYVFFCWK